MNDITWPQVAMMAVIVAPFITIIVMNHLPEIVRAWRTKDE